MNRRRPKIVEAQFPEPGRDIVETRTEVGACPSQPEGFDQAKPKASSGELRSLPNYELQASVKRDGRA